MALESAPARGAESLSRRRLGCHTAPVKGQQCGILAHGFVRPRCADCGHDKLLAFSCKRRGLQPFVRPCRGPGCI